MMPQQEELMLQAIWREPPGMVSCSFCPTEMRYGDYNGIYGKAMAHHIAQPIFADGEAVDAVSVYTCRDCCFDRREETRCCRFDK